VTGIAVPQRLLSPRRAPTALERWCRRRLLDRMEALRWGRLTLVDGDRILSFGDGREFQAAARVTVSHPSFYRDLLFGGSVGAGEAYVAGSWSADDLTAVVRILVRNKEVMDGLDATAWGKASAWTRRGIHSLRRNSPWGSRRNVRAHYDLGNDFYALWLDPTMTYSCGIFEAEDSTMAEASAAKYERLCRKLGISKEHRVLEIGTGWGGFALHAASRFGCRVTTATISCEQRDWAVERVRKAGLADRVEVLLEDYRTISGRYDRLVSIEMVEAVGRRYLGEFFQRCADRLEPDGLMGLQAITIRDGEWERYTRQVDFISRYIFPGGCLASVAALAKASSLTDLRPVHLEDITPHYARTLREWRIRFFENLDAVKALGFSDAFIRMWEFYLRYCEGGFLERYIGDVQMVLARPLFRGDSILPPLGGAP